MKEEERFTRPVRVRSQDLVVDKLIAASFTS
jgi:hypothetical protein